MCSEAIRAMVDMVGSQYISDSMNIDFSDVLTLLIIVGFLNILEI